MSAGSGAEHQSEQHPPDADPRVRPQLAGLRELDERRRDLRGRREEAVVEHTGSRGQLPQHEQRQRRQDREYAVAGLRAEPASRAWALDAGRGGLGGRSRDRGVAGRLAHGGRGVELGRHVHRPPPSTSDAQRLPDLVDQLAVAGPLAQLEHVARPLERDVEQRLLAPRPRAHHHDLVAERDGLVDAVGDEHDRLAGVGPDPQQLLLQHRLGQLVERRERLVHEQHLGVVGERAGERHALLHAARQLMRVGVGELAEPGLVEPLADHVAPFARGHLAHAQAVRRVVADGHPGEDRLPLEDHRVGGPVARPALQLGDARRRLLEPGEHAQQRALAAPARADDDEEAAGLDRHRKVVDRGHDAALGRELLDESLDADLRGGDGHRCASSAGPSAFAAFSANEVSIASSTSTSFLISPSSR